MDNGAHHGSRVRLLEVEPDLGRFLTGEELEEADRLSVPVLTAGRGSLDLDRQLREAGAFGALVLDGMILHRLTLGDHAALRLLGPGDILSRAGQAGFGPLSESSHRTIDQVRLALFDDRMLLAGQRLPRLFAGLHVRMGEQHERLAAQLAICQLPRVEERVLSIMWLLADVWGRVTVSGTVLPIGLTHDALGELIGARRPTVTLALKDLSDRGALLRQDGGWLLTGSMPGREPTRPPRLREGAVDLPRQDDGMWRDTLPAGPPAPTAGALSDLVAALRAGHDKAQGDVRRRLARSQRVRERNRLLREEIAIRRRRREPAP